MQMLCKINVRFQRGEKTKYISEDKYLIRSLNDLTSQQLTDSLLHTEGNNLEMCHTNAACGAICPCRHSQL